MYLVMVFIYDQSKVKWIVKTIHFIQKDSENQPYNSPELMHCDLNEITQITVWIQDKQENTAWNTNGPSAQNINKYSTSRHDTSLLTSLCLWIKPILIQMQQKLKI